MTAISSLRILSVIGFLLLMAPFYRQCAGGKMAEAPAEEAPVTQEVAPIAEEMLSTATAIERAANQKANAMQFKKDSIAVIRTQDSIEKFTPTYQKIYQTIDDETNENAFELAWQAFHYIGIMCQSPQKYWNEFNGQNKEVKATCIARPLYLFSFVCIVILSLLNVGASFAKNNKLVWLVAKWNIFLLFFAVGCIFLDCWFEQISQFEWGYYVFTAVQIAILTISKKSPATNTTNQST